MRYRLGNIHLEVRIWNHDPRCYGLPSRHLSNISLAKINRRRRFFLLKKYLRVLKMIGSGTRSIRIHQRMSTIELHSFCNVALLKLIYPAISACKHIYAEHHPGSTAPSSACPSVWRILGVFHVILCQARCPTPVKPISTTPVTLARMLAARWLGDHRSLHETACPSNRGRWHRHVAASTGYRCGHGHVFQSWTWHHHHLADLGVLGVPRLALMKGVELVGPRPGMGMLVPGRFTDLYGDGGNASGSGLSVGIGDWMGRLVGCGR